MKIIKKAIIALMVIGIVGACDNLEMEGLQTNPNLPSPEKASLNDLYNSIQLQFTGAFNTSEFNPGAAARMYMNVAYTYRTMAPNATMNGLWITAYNGLFPDVDALIALSEGKNFNIHVGSAKIMKAYVMMTLVDLMGDVPYSETGQGTDVISPKLDDDASVYAAANALLDEAIGLLTGTNAPAPAVDNFYGGDADKWITLANTLKLRAALNTDDVATFNSIVAGGNIIDAADGSEDFQFNYGSNRTNPDSRNPFYPSHYETGDGDYISNYFMWMLRLEKKSVIAATAGATVVDPRIRYYFYRKVDDSAGQDPTTYSCHFSNQPDISAKPDSWDAIDPDLPYCVPSDDGYSGRDHLNGEGIPPDGPIRTSYGLYPFGGDFDDDSFEDTRNEGTTGGGGEGITPLLLSSFVDFMRAEAVLRLGASGDARALLESGMRVSMNKVESFEALVPTKMATSVTLKSGATGTVKELYGMDSDGDDEDAYVTEVLAMYDAAPTGGGAGSKLDVVIKEFYIAAWGNGIEVYNMYRRTSLPGNVQPSLEPPGPFILSFFYPPVAIDRNANIEQKAELNVPVFWQDSNIAATLY